MSRSTWLTKPTHAKAVKIAKAFSLAVERGLEPRLARCYAGYYAETATQRGHRTTVRWGGQLFRGTEVDVLLDAAVRAGHRYAKGRNSGNYERLFVAHAAMVASLLAAAGAPHLDLADDTPPALVADRFEQADEPYKAAAIRWALAVAPPEPPKE